jgi:hypothetical protein
LLTTLALTHTPRRRAFAWGCGAGLSDSALLSAYFFKYYLLFIKNKKIVFLDLTYITMKLSLGKKKGIPLFSS